MTPLRAAARRVARRHRHQRGAAPGDDLRIGLAFVAATVTIVGLLLPAPLPPTDPLSPAARLGIAAGVMAMAQLASLRLRVGTGRLSRRAGARPP